MVDNKNSYAAAVGSNDNQPEGTVTSAPEVQPPPYSEGGPSTSTSAAHSASPPNPKAHPQYQTGPRHAQPYNVNFTRGQRPTPAQTEAGVVVLIGHSPEYYHALSRARRRFWGALFWALLIYLVAAAIVGGGVEDALRNKHSHKHKPHGGEVVIDGGAEWASA